MTFFSFVGNGPAIPVEVLHALDDERLVLFCGAGVSMPDLPSFMRLTQEAFIDARIELDGQSLPINPAIKDAFCNQEYDKSLDILEREEQRSSGHLRRFVRKRLTGDIAPGCSTDLHDALLELARLRPSSNGTPRGYRLVTTNFDDRFERAQPDIARWIRAAPLLARPSPHSHRHITFLHGRIETEAEPQDPDCRTLDLTRADIGDAYLRDGYAARFALELFAEFTVLFVGYGLNDPAMRYLMDAFAAERDRGGRFREAYAFASDEGQPERQKALWRSKSVVPILYRTTEGRNPHAVLAQTIIEWARRRRAGLDGHREVFRQALRPFQPGNDDSDPENHLANLAWTLAREDGVAAERFVNYSDDGPVKGAKVRPHLSWLGPLLECTIQVPDVCGRGSRECRLADLAKPSWQLCRWATSGFADANFISWTIRNEALLCGPTEFGKAFRDQVDFAITRSSQPLPEPYVGFWRLVFSIMDQRPSYRLLDVRSIVAPHDGRLGDWQRFSLQHLLAPRLAWPEVAWRHIDIDGFEVGNAARQIRDLATFEVQLGSRHTFLLLLPMLRDRSKLSTAGLIGIADELTTILAATFDLGRALGDFFAIGYSHVDCPDVSSAGAEDTADDWTKLTGLLMEAFGSALREAPLAAVGLSHRWLAIWARHKHTLFSRLWLCAAAEPSVVGVEDVLAVLRSSPELLWSGETTAEILHLLTARAVELTAKLKPSILDQIVSGPPASGRGDGGPEGAELVRNSVAERLQALWDGNAELSDEFRALLSAWKAEIQRPEGTRPEQLPVERLISSPTSIIVAQIKDRIDGDGLISDEKAADDLLAILRDQPSRSAEILGVLAEANDVRSSIWQNLIHTLRRSPDGHPEIIPVLISLLEQHTAISLAANAALADWTLELSNHLIDDQLFWRAFKVAADVSSGGSSLIGDEGTLVGAMNSPCGDLAEAILRRRWKAGASIGQGLDEPYRAALDQLIQREGDCGGYARLICMPWLVSLTWLDPAWTKAGLIDHMRLNSAERSHAIGLWKAYLHKPRMSKSLLDWLKQDFLELLGLRSELGEEAFDRACGLFADIVTAEAGAFTNGETRSALYKMGPAGAGHLLDRFGVRLGHSENPLGLWTTILGPWIEAHWPRTAAFQDIEIKSEGVGLLLKSREAFPAVLITLEHCLLLREIGNPSLALYELRHRNEQAQSLRGEFYDYVGRHPGDVCRWLALALPRELKTVGDRTWLREILHRIPEPSLDTAEHRRWGLLWERTGQSPRDG